MNNRHLDAALANLLSLKWHEARVEKIKTLGTRLGKEGVVLPGFDAETATATYLLRLPLIELDGELYASNRNFLEIMQPLAEAILQREYNKEYPAPSLPADSLTASWQSTMAYCNHKNFEQKHALTSRRGMTQIEPGYFHGYEVKWRKSSVLDMVVDKNGKDRQLFAFAKGFLDFLGDGQRLPIHNNTVYARIDRIQHLDLAIKTLAAIMEESRKQDKDPDAEFWQRFGDRFEKTGDKKSFFQRIFWQP